MRAIATETNSNRARRGAALLASLLLASACAAGIAVQRAPAQSVAELESSLSELDQVQSRQGAVEAEIEAQNARIDDLIGQVAELKSRQRAVREELAVHQAELDEATAELDAERRRLEIVQARLQRAVAVLSDYLVEVYKAGERDSLSVVLDSASWSEMLAEPEYLGSVERYGSSVVARVRDLREDVAAAVEQLADVRERIKRARDEVAARERQITSQRDEIQARWGELVAAREERERALASLQDRQRALQRDLAISAPNGQTAALVNGRAIPPPNAPLVVKAVIEAGNEIADKPYLWGGGHGSWDSPGYDCSGAISYALRGGGLIDRPRDSTGFMTWGSAGVGSWITVFAASGHAYAVIAGLRWDTSGTGGSGPRWQTAMRSPAGFVPRHPAGY